MIVYVESNFVQEIALEQEQAASALSILALAEAGRIMIALPAFALIEPFWTLRYRGEKWTRSFESLAAQWRELRRSGLHTHFVTPLTPAAIREREENSLEATALRLLNVGVLLEINEAVLVQAMVYWRRYGLSPQDSLIYTAIVEDLTSRSAQEDKCFISRDDDFRIVESELSTYNCQYITSFTDALRFVQR
jgi:predicted nucleic acid-binding protein